MVKFIINPDLSDNYKLNEKIFNILLSIDGAIF